jgi:DNA-directed RNA polymerase subunit M/transcription elongation factor TFIIS
MYYLKIQDEDGKIGDTLIYYCRNCGHEDKTLSTTNVCVSDIQFRTSEKKYTHIVNEYTKYDPTLPRINTIKCPNQECSSNKMGGGAGKSTDRPKSTDRLKSTEAEKAEKLAEKAAKSAARAAKSAAKAAKSATKAQTHLETILSEDEEGEQQAHDAAPHGEREVIYIRYDDTNMKYVYLCVHCDMTWRTDNRL